MGQKKSLFGIKQQILMVTLIPSSLLILSLTAYLVGTQFDDLDQSFAATGNAISEQIASAAVTGLLTRNSHSLTLLAEQTIEQHPTVHSIQILDQEGRVVVVMGSIRAKEIEYIADFNLPIKATNSTVELLSSWGQDNSPLKNNNWIQIGTVQVHISGLDHAARKADLMINTFLFSIIGLLLSAALAIFFSARIAQPIEKLIVAMKRMRKGALDVQVDEHAQGEIRELQRGFNMMTREIEDANENMLMQVDQATHDLQASMEVLEIKNVELDLARKRALSASRFKSEFLASMSHEIRTPMNGILGFTNLLAKSELNKSQEEYIKTIRASSANLLTIIDDILDLSKLEAGKLTLELQPFSLRECIENTISLLAPMAHEKQLELVSIVYNDMPDYLVGDQTRIAQIVTNLVNNAIKFTDSGEIVLRAMLNEEATDTVEMILSICDTGSGIAKNEQHAIFSAFEQGANISSLSSKGTGLGLSICKRLASAMGGDISLNSTLGEGSCFSVTLRLNKDLANTNISQEMENRIFSGQKLLLIDLNHASRMVLRNDLLNLGLQVDDRGSYDLTNDQDFLNYELIVIALDAEAVNAASHLHKVKNITNIVGHRTTLLASVSSQKKLDELAATGARVVITKPIKRNLLRETIATFIPISEAAMQQPQQPRYTSDIEDGNWMKGARVLVVDDNKINRSLMQSILTGFGAIVFNAENGQEAVDKMHSLDVDLILMDIHMPVMDGFEATEKIRNLTNGTVPIIALTADAMEKNRNEINRVGFNGYLIKPLDDTKLQKLIAEMIRVEPNDGPLSISADNATDKPLKNALILPVKNSEKALSIAGGSETIVKKLFVELLATLDKDFSQILESSKNADWNTLWQQLHKMQGSTAVCALPALHQSIHEVQFAVKQEDQQLIDNRLASMEIEISRVKNEG